MKAAMCAHLLARCHSFKSEFKQAIDYEKEVQKIYAKHFGKDHDKTKGFFNFKNFNLFFKKESDEFLKFLTNQAVAVAKTMNAMASKTNVKGNLPLPMQPPERGHESLSLLTHF